MKNSRYSTFAPPMRRNYVQDSDNLKKRPMSPSKEIMKSKQDYAKKIQSKDMLDKAQGILTLLAKSQNTPMGQIILTAVANTVNSLTKNAKESIPAYQKDSVRRLGVSSGIDESRVHITRFHVGRPSTRSVLDAEKINGSSQVILDLSTSDGIEATIRKYLHRSFGFNQKGFDFLGIPFYVTVQDYINL